MLTLTCMHADVLAAAAPFLCLAVPAAGTGWRQGSSLTPLLTAQGMQDQSLTTIAMQPAQDMGLIRVRRAWLGRMGKVDSSKP